MEELRSRVLVLIVSRLVLTALVLGVPFVALSPAVLLSEFRYILALLVVALSAVYYLIWRYSSRLDLAYNLQFCADIVLTFILVYISGGIFSLLTPLYVLIIVYASLIRQREGGVRALALTVISYLLTVHLAYFWPFSPAFALSAYSELLNRISLNLLGFGAVAWLGINLSQRLQTTRLELGAARVLHENIVNSLRSGLITLDLQGGITSVNMVARDICGLSSEEISNEPLSRFFPPDVLDEVLHNDFDSTNRPLRMEFWMPGKDDQMIFLGLSCSPLVSHDREKIGYLISFQDLSEIKTREDQLRLKEKMAAIGQFSADMAHEIRNPLGALYGSIQLLQTDLELSPDTARLVEIILRECERLNKILGDFLAYAGPRPSHPVAVDLVSLLRETTELFSNHPDCREDHCIELEAEVASVPCLADPHQLRQVAWNVVQNAMRAMPQGGRLGILVEQTPTRVWLRFKDDGIGMDEEQQRKLFQPFHRGFRQGSGLGMAIVYQIIQQHAGGIEVESRPGKGTRISIWLPAQAAAGRAVEPVHMAELKP